MASDKTYGTKIRFIQGGDILDVAPGGKITGDGAQAATIAALKVDYTTGDLDAEAEVIAAVNAQNTAINAIIAALKNVGIVAAS